MRAGWMPGAVGVVLMVVLGASGCSSDEGRPVVDGSGMPTTAVAVVPTPSASPTDALPSYTPPDCPSGSPAPGGTVNGRDLRALLPVCQYQNRPADWTPELKSLEDGGPASAPAAAELPGKDCSFLVDAKGFNLSTDFRTAWARESDDAPSDSVFHPVVDDFIAAYQPGDAKKLLGDIRDFADRCSSFDVYAGSQTTMTVTADPLSGLGDEAIDLKCTPGPNAIVQRMESIIVRVGDRVLFVTGDNHQGGMPKVQDLATMEVRGLSG
ncbi:hypothetical protein QBC98_005202 [Kitasatospora acidiphila]